jgi:hypothetical protein
MNRALRRHHTRRIKARFYRNMKTRLWDWQPTPKEAGMFANHGKVCSCWMCGNPRHFHGELTLQERRHSLSD